MIQKMFRSIQAADDQSMAIQNKLVDNIYTDIRFASSRQKISDLEVIKDTLDVATLNIFSAHLRRQISNLIKFCISQIQVVKQHSIKKKANASTEAVRISLQTATKQADDHLTHYGSAGITENFVKELGAIITINKANISSQDYVSQKSLAGLQNRYQSYIRTLNEKITIDKIGI